LYSVPAVRYRRLIFANTSFRVVRLMVLSIPATVTVTFGATNHFALRRSPSRVTKLLAQFAATPSGKFPLTVAGANGVMSRIAVPATST
jgi:hypothetical protein